VINHPLFASIPYSKEGRELLILVAIALALGVIYLIAQQLARKKRDRLKKLTRFRKE
jgi:hypothetical protein